ncbi:hypothetical protein AB4Z22_14345 [Paenibacillus sp. TAF58]
MQDEATRGDVTKTYAYKTAAALQADYSVVAYSGHGIVSGYTGNGEKNTGLLVPNNYDIIADLPAVLTGIWISTTHHGTLTNSYLI